MSLQPPNHPESRKTYDLLADYVRGVVDGGAQSGCPIQVRDLTHVGMVRQRFNYIEIRSMFNGLRVNFLNFIQWVWGRLLTFFDGDVSVELRGTEVVAVKRRFQARRLAGVVNAANGLEGRFAPPCRMTSACFKDHAPPVSRGNDIASLKRVSRRVVERHSDGLLFMPLSTTDRPVDAIGGAA